MRGHSPQATARSSARKGLIFTAAFLLLCNFAPAQAQDERHPQRGFHPGNSYAFSDIETISMSGGNLMLNVPLGSLPGGRGGSPGFKLSLTYNSKLYDTHIEEIINETGDKENQTYLNRSLEGGWRYSLPAGYTMRLISRGNEEPLPGCTTETGPLNYQKNAYVWKMQVIYPDGSTHEFRPTGHIDLFNDGYFNISANGWISAVSFIGGSNNSSCTYNESQGTTGPMVYYSTDGSYTRLVVDHVESGDHSGRFNPWTLYFPNGRRLNGNRPNEPQRMYDRNNNYVEVQSITYNDHPAKKIVDQLGRYIIIETDQANNQDYVYMQGVGGEQMRSTVRWKPNYVRKEYVATVEGQHRGNSYNTPLHMGSSVVDQIILPAQAGGLNYTFGYNGTEQDLQTFSYGWGELNSVTLPSGAKATYAYALDGVSASGSSAVFPSWKNVLNNKPKRKQLTYRKEHDLSSPVSNSPCDPQSEACTTEEWVYGLETPLPLLLTQDPWITKVKGPDGGVLQEYSGDDPNSPSFNRAVKTIRPDGMMMEQTWEQNRSSGMTGQVVNPYLKTEFTSIKDAAGNYVKTAIKDYSYDKNGNVTEVREYDWVSYGSVSRDIAGRPTGVPSDAPLKRATSNKYYNPTPDASDTATISPNAYHQASAPQLLSLIESSEVGDGSQVFSRAEFFYDNPNTTGNMTELRRWDSSKAGITRPLSVANSIFVTNQYDPLVLGKITQTTDALGTSTEYIYGSINGFTDLYPTETRVAAGTAVQRTTRQEYDFWTGLMTRGTDVDNNVTTSTSYDDLGRPTLVRMAEGKPEETRTITEYSDVSRRVIVRSDLNIAGDARLVSIQHYDQLGRVRLGRQLEDASTQSATDETTGIKVQTRYAFSGFNSYQLASNPYRAALSSTAGSEATMGWTKVKE